MPYEIVRPSRGVQPTYLRKTVEKSFEDENPQVSLASQVEGLDTDLSSQLA